MCVKVAPSQDNKAEIKMQLCPLGLRQRNQVVIYWISLYLFCNLQTDEDYET